MNLTRSHIARTLSAETGLSLRDSREVVSALTGAITRALSSGADVRIRNFGRFRVVSGAARRNNGFSGSGSMIRAARKIVRFKPANCLKACLLDGAVECEGQSGVDLIFEQLRKNIELPDQIQKVLDNHNRWVESEGRKGRRAELKGFDLKGADLFGSNLKSADLSEAGLPCADLSDSDLEGAILENADLTGASLAWANLTHANLRCARLRGADLRWADLRWADFSEADLNGANLSGADLNNAVLNGADLRGARLKDTVLEKKNPFSPSALKIRLKKFRFY